MSELDLAAEIRSGSPDEPMRQLIQVLEAARELVMLKDNDFAWSGWRDSSHATREINDLIAQLKAGVLPREVSIGVVFAPTGPLQEVSLSCGWTEAFLRLAERYDAVARRLWLRE